MSEKRFIEKITTPHKISLYKNGENPNIYYYFTWRKKSYRGSTGTEDKSTARNKVCEIFYDITKGLKGKGKQKTVKLDDVVKKFLQHKEVNKIGQRTLVEYKRQSKYLLERFRGRDINTFVSKSEYADYIEWRRKYYDTHEKKKVQLYERNGIKIKGRKFEKAGDPTINRECRLLCSILRYGKEFMAVLKDVQIPAYTVIPEEMREEILFNEEYEKLRIYWTKKNPYYWSIIDFVRNTGIRYPSELNRICWKDIYLEKSYVVIRDRKSKNKKKPLNTAVPLVGSAKEIIEALKRRENIPKGSEDKVFINDKGIQIKNIIKPFKISVKKCGIEKNLTPYSLRHTWVTSMVGRPDIPMKFIATIAGHSSTNMIDERYSHLRGEHMVSTFQRSEAKKQEILKTREKEKAEKASE